MESVFRGGNYATLARVVANLGLSAQDERELREDLKACGTGPGALRSALIALRPYAEKLGPFLYKEVALRFAAYCGNGIIR